MDGPEVHDDGEIWGQTLWSLRGALIAAHGSAAGLGRTRRYVTQAMRISPPEPSFLDMRNAILQASIDEADDARIWKVFADRGMGYFASTTGGDDVDPSADSTDPATLSGEATVNGTVRDDETAPVEGAEVAIAALGDELVDQTDSAGHYTLRVPVPEGGGHIYPALRARKPAYLEDAKPVALDDGVPETIDFNLERDWSSAVGGATVEDFTGEDNTNDGCGPGGLIDDDPGAVWGTNNTAGGQRIVIDLGAPIDVARIAIDPAAGCGDDASAALGGYELRGSTGPDGPFSALGAPDTFGTTHNGTLNTAFTGPAPRIRFVALLAQSPQDNSPGGDGEDFIDVAELHVARTPASAVGPTADTGGVQGVGTSGATLTGDVTPHDATTEVAFEYGTSTAYGGTAGADTLAAGNTATPVAAVVHGLEPSTTYHYRVVANTGGHSFPGADETFTTGALPPPPTPTPNPVASPSPVAPPSPPPPPVATVTSLSGADLTADRRGFFKVKAVFGDAAALGSARFTVYRKGKRLARALTPVRPGRTVVKTLRLNERGRRVIRPGRSKTVKLQLRLPSGEKFVKTLKLTRKRR
jgi:hypothetical protein